MRAPAFAASWSGRPLDAKIAVPRLRPAGHSCRISRRALRSDPSRPAAAHAADVRQDPLAALRSVHERFGLPFSAEAEARARHWIGAPAQHLSAVNFSLAEFALDASMVEPAFGPYREAEIY